ncbi:MAG: GSCFA domain-containing protein [Rikenellaceae bacterium]|nr:GSCFA domain-containing protein [Rikenellaceae bacterium]
MNWQTKVEIPPLKERIRYKDKVLFLGSCFASEIGSVMRDLRFDAEVNPFGVMFNPASISLSLERLSSGKEFAGSDIFLEGDIWKSFYHGSEFAAMSADGFLESNNQILRNASRHFHESKFVVLTLGTSWIYRENKGGKVVSNCHKLPASAFNREFLDAQESFSLIRYWIDKYPQKQWIITVSPVRHLKDGARGNQISKANLIVASAMLEKYSPSVSYFPTYEIFMDELRDYRFYASDMVHPSADSVRYIWEKFLDFAVSQECNDKIKLVGKLNLMKRHKVLFRESKDYKLFLIKMEEIEQKITSMDL